MTDTETNPETAAGGTDAWEEALIADLRANGGRPSDGRSRAPDHRHVLDREDR